MIRRHVGSVSFRLSLLRRYINYVLGEALRFFVDRFEKQKRAASLCDAWFEL